MSKTSDDSENRTRNAVVQEVCRKFDEAEKIGWKGRLDCDGYKIWQLVVHAVEIDKSTRATHSFLAHVGLKNRVGRELSLRSVQDVFRKVRRHLGVGPSKQTA